MRQHIASNASLWAGLAFSARSVDRDWCGKKIRIAEHGLGADMVGACQSFGVGECGQRRSEGVAGEPIACLVSKRRRQETR